MFVGLKRTTCLDLRLGVVYGQRSLLPSLTEKFADRWYDRYRSVCVDAPLVKTLSLERGLAACSVAFVKAEEWGE